MKDLSKRRKELLEEIEQARRNKSGSVNNNTQTPMNNKDTHISNDIFKVIADNSREWIYWISPEKEYTYVSPAFEKITGYTVREFLEEANIMEKIIHPDYRDVLLEHFKEEFDSREVHTFDFGIKTRQGEERWIYHTCRPIFDSQGKYLGRYCENQDILNKKGAEENRAQVENFQALSDVFNGAVWFIADKKVLFVSNEFKDIFGITLKTMYENPTAFMTHIHPDDKERILKVIGNEQYSEYGHMNEDIRLILPDGSTKFVWLRSYPVKRQGKIAAKVGLAEDKTDVIRLKEDLKKAEERFNKSIELAFDGIVYGKYVRNNNNDIVDFVTIRVNKAIEKLLQLKKESLQNKKSAELPPALLKLGLEKMVGLSPTILNNELMRLDTVHKANNKPYSINAFSVGGDNFVVMIHEATKSMTQQSPDKAAFEADILNDVTEAVIIFDAQAKIQKWLGAAETIFGYSQKEALGKQIPFIYHKDERDSLIKEQIDKIKSDGKWRGDINCTTKDGSDITVDLLIKALPEKEKKGTSLIAFATDISKRKRIESEAKKYVENLKSLKAALDKKELEEKQLKEKIETLTNEVTEAKQINESGTDADELKRQLMQSEEKTKKLFAIKEQKEAELLALQNKLTEAEHTLKEYLDAQQTGKQKDDPEVAAKLQKADRLLRAMNASREKLFAIISDDFKHFLSSLYDYSDQLLEQIQEVDNPTVVDTAVNISGVLQNISDLMQNLMHYADLQMGRIKAEPMNVFLFRLVNKVIPEFEEVAEAKEINIKIEIPEDLTVFADSDLLKAALRNLISNAIKYSHRGGSVRIRTIVQKNEVALTVTDSGIGISKDEQSRLFRFDDALIKPGTDGEKGSGLGLIICRHFIELNKGKISILSEEKRGTTMKINLPQSQEL